MVIPVEKRSSNKFCDFHNNKGHSTDECMQLKKQIEKLVRAGKLSHLIKEIKQGRDQPKMGKKEAPAKDKSMAIYMIQPWHRVTRHKVTQSFKRVSEITFPSLTTNSGTEGPLVIEAEIGGHMIHRMYVDGDHSAKAWMNFMIVRSLSPYNGIIGRPGIQEIQAVPSTTHGMLKFPVDGGVVTIRSTILIPAECATVVTSSKEIPKEAGVCHENFKIAPHPDFPDQKVAIGGTLSAKGRTDLCSLLKKNLDIFAWQPSDMTGVPRSVAKHRLNIREGYSPVRQKKGAKPRIVRKPSKQRIVTPFQKSTGKLNLFAVTPLSVFWTLTKVIIRYRWQSQMKRKRLSTPAKGYIAIPKCPLALKTLSPRTSGWAMEGMFLVYMISPDGIKLCPDKIDAILQLPSPRTIKEVQSLNGKLASLNRFLYKSAEKSLPLFKTLKKCIKKSDFHWTPDAEQAFKQLKQHLSELPLLVAPLSASHGAIIAVLMTERGSVPAT
ncbi:hypothetical protein Tco_0753624 [Tanacetum coccineum]